MSEAAFAGAQGDALLTAGLPPGSHAAMRRLGNGLRIVAAEVPEARQLRLVGAVGVGYLDEPAERRGLAHLLEHGLFLGSRRFPGEGELIAWIGDRGGRYNAHTDERVTDVHLHLPPDAADAGLTRLVELLCRPRLDPERLAREVDVLDAEFHARLDDPALHRLAALGRLCRPGHPARACHAGHRGTLDDASGTLASALRDFHRRHYRAERMALAMLGPLPLAEQLALLERHGSTIPGGAAVHEAPAWRWNAPGGIAWCPARDRPSAAVLELFWPLPEALAAAHADRLEALAARLADGRLAASLQGLTGVDDLVVDLAPTGTGPALALRLELEDAAPPLAPLLAGCRHALERALTERLEAPPPVPVDLDAWPRRQACRLAGDVVPAPPNAAHLAPWLAGDQCRWLWRGDAGRGDAWSLLEETGTRCRPLPLSREPPQAPPERPAPVLATSPPRQAAGDEVPGRLLHDARLSLWWGSPAWPQPGQRASWCLGWPADPAGRTARLARWRRRTLALRQAATAQGFALTLEADAGGDWLIARGDPERLASLVAQTLEAWTTAPRDAASPPSATGLIAQQLLNGLETHPPPLGDARPLLLGWASGHLDTNAVRQDIRRFVECLPGMGNGPRADAPTRPGKENWLPPQGTERAVMLEVGGDADPRSRWLLQLLAGCHDAAFHREMRRRRGFGYVAAVRYREAAGWPRLGYVVQSPHASVDAMRQAILDFLAERGAALARLAPAELERRRRGLIARQGPPETYPEAIARTWQALRHRPAGTADTAWRPAPWAEELAALESLGVADLGERGALLSNGDPTWRWWYHAP